MVRDYSPFYIHGGITPLGILLLCGLGYMLWWVCSFGYAVFHTSETYGGGSFPVRIMFISLLVFAPLVLIWLMNGGANGIAIHPIIRSR